MRGRTGGALAIAAFTAATVSACDDQGAGAADRELRPGAAAISPTAPLVGVTAVQLASFADRESAQRMIDSLDAAGWTTSLRQGTVRAETVWRVQIAPTANPDLAARIAYTLSAAGRRPIVVNDSARLAADVEVIPVNRGTHGMSARTRWVVARDRRSLLVVEDPVGVEAEAIPNGFVFASDRGSVIVQRDSVWDVAPSPDWRRVAFGKAHVLPAAEGEAVPEATWRRVAAAVKLPLDSVRRNAFMTSGMVPAYGFAQPVVLDVSARAVGASMTQGGTTLPIAGGWRVRWAEDGDVLAIGSKPERVQDDSPSASWLGVDPATGAVIGPLEQTELDPLQWVEGPVMDVSVDVDFREARSLAIDDGTLESRGGWVRLNGRIIGPGLAVAATRSGEFIVALAPRADARQYEAKVEPVVYRTRGVR